MFHFTAIALSPNADKDRIVGGHNVTMRDAPYQVSVQHGVTRRHVGGGVFIGRFTILTTANCIALTGPNATQITIRYGSINHEAGGRVRTVRRVIVHPNFDRNSMENDIAIIKLRRRGRSVTHVNLPPRQFALRTNDNVTVSGWGQQPGQRNITTNLQAVDLRVTDQQSCVTSYERLPRLPNVTNRMWCAGWPTGERGICPVRIRNN